MTVIKIGILLPKSSLYPSIGFDLLNGLKAQLDSVQHFSYELLYENIGTGGDSNEIYNKTEKLLLQESWIVLAFLDHSEATKLDMLFRQQKRILIVLDPGAHVPLTWNNGSPYRFTISLQTAFNNYVTGTLAAKAGNKRAFFASSFYEGGYLQTYSYLKGHEHEGGTIYFHSIVPFHRNEYQTSDLVYAFEHHQPEAILAQFSAEAGEVFLGRYAQTSICRQVPLYVSAFMLEESWLDTVPYLFDGIKGCTSWCRSLDNDMNHQFINAIRHRYATTPTIFTLLGWESGLLINQLAHNPETPKRTDEILEKTESMELHSPRGVLRLHKDSRIFFSPVYQTEIVNNPDTGNCQLQLIGDYPCESEKSAFTNETPNGVFSKWTNTYLCI